MYYVWLFLPCFEYLFFFFAMRSPKLETWLYFIHWSSPSYVTQTGLYFFSKLILHQKKSCYARAVWGNGAWNFPPQCGIFHPPVHSVNLWILFQRPHWYKPFFTSMLRNHCTIVLITFPVLSSTPITAQETCPTSAHLRWTHVAWGSELRIILIGCCVRRARPPLTRPVQHRAIRTVDIICSSRPALHACQETGPSKS